MLRQKLEGEFLILDYDSSLEALLDGLILAAVLSTLVALNSGLLWGVLLGLLALGVASGARYKVDVHLRVDRERRQLWLHRCLFGATFRSLLADYSQFECLTVSGRRSGYGQWPWQPVQWEEACFLVLKSGKTIRLSDYAASEKAGDLEQLARIFETRWVPLSDFEKRKLKVWRKRGRIRVTHVGPGPDPFLLTLSLVILIAFSWSAYVVVFWS